MENNNAADTRLLPAVKKLTQYVVDYWTALEEATREHTRLSTEEHALLQENLDFLEPISKLTLTRRAGSAFPTYDHEMSDETLLALVDEIDARIPHIKLKWLRDFYSNRNA